MLVVSIILEAAVAVIAVLAARAGRPSSGAAIPLRSCFHIRGLCALRPCAPATMASRGASAVGLILAGDRYRSGGSVGTVLGKAGEVAWPQ
jgi:hypothetical protein